MENERKRIAVDWAAVRRAYELNEETIKQICLEFGITKSGLEWQSRKGHWISRQAAKNNRQRVTLDRLFAVLERQVAKLANLPGETLGDKEAQQLSELVKNFDKLTSVKKIEANDGGPAANKDMSDIREKLAKRIDQYNNR